MNERERLAVGALMAVLALVAPGFLLHEAPRFAGSLAGGVLGIAAASLFLLLLAYSLAKRIGWIRAGVARHASLRAVLVFHVYAGAVGAVLGVLHSGHRYHSPLGIGLVSAMLAVVLTGFVGRYYLAQLGTDLRDQQVMLGVLRTRYDQLAAEAPRARGDGVAAMLLGQNPGALLALATGARTPDAELRRLLGGMADLEYAIARREVLKRALSRWTVLHVAAALVMYSLLALHVWTSIYFGLRWLP